MSVFERAMRALRQGMALEDVAARWRLEPHWLANARARKDREDLARWNALGARAEARSL